MQARTQLLQLALKYNGEWDKIYKAVSSREFVDEKDKIHYSGNYITILDNEYPDSLKRIYKPPFVLFYEGDITLLKDKTKKLAVGTTREFCEKNENLTKQILTETNYTLILGGRSPTDEVIVKGTNNPIIIVAGTPLSMVDKKLKKQEMLILTEYPEKVNVEMQNFPMRNRIIAGLCDKLLVLNSKNNSSVMHLVIQVLDNGKEVMVVPTSPKESEQGNFNNKLIYEGAIPVWTKDGLCEIMG